MGWVAIDKSGCICEFRERPIRDEDRGVWVSEYGVTIHPPIIHMAWVSVSYYLKKRFGIFHKMSFESIPVNVK